jgi:hypothetical protein
MASVSPDVESPNVESPAVEHRSLWWNRRAPLVVLTAVIVAFQEWQVVHREFDPDELEHLHAAFLIAEGDVPYRDFFEHHPPALYLLLQPIFWLFGPGIATITSARFLMLTFSWGTLLATAILARRALGAGLLTPHGDMTETKRLAAEFDSGWIVALLLAACTTFWMKGIEVRPDVPAVCLLTAAASVVWSHPVVAGTPSACFSWPRWLTAGLLCGTATLFTPKAVIPAAAISLASTLWPNQGRGDVRPMVAMAFAGAWYWGLALVGMALWSGSPKPFFDSVVGLHFRWNASTPTLLHLRPHLVENAAIWLGAVAAAGVVIRDLLRTASADNAISVASKRIVAVAVLCAASLPGVKAAFPQYYLLWTPFLVLAAVTGWQHCLQHLRPTYVRFFTAAFIIGSGLLAARAFLQGRNGALPGLFDSLFVDSSGTVAVRWNSTVLPVLLSMVFVAALITWFVATEPRRAVWLCLFAGLLYGWCRNVDAVLRTNAAQCERIRRVNELVPAREGKPASECETVFDGFTGYGVFRQHAFDLWWINEYSSRLPVDGLPRLPLREMDTVRMERHEGQSPTFVTVRWAGDDVEALFRAPRVVIYDRELRTYLPQSVRAWIEAEYAPDALPPILIRRGTR